MENFDKRITINEEDKVILSDIEKIINQYEMEHHLDLIKTNPKLVESLNISRELLAEMSSEDVLHHAYVIAGHINKLSSECNRQKCALQHIQNAYNDGMSQYLATMEFPEYTKNEVKEQMVCMKHKVVYKLRELMRKIQACVQLHQDDCQSLRRMHDDLNQIARGK
jgi:hypothetical protein